MPQFDENHVKLCGGIVVWDGVTQPETVAQGKQAGKLKYSLKVVFPPTCPDLQLFDQLAQQALLQSKWRGQLPPGGRMPIGQVQPGEFNDQFPGWYVISFKTTLKTPDIYDEHGAPLDVMRMGQLIYTGQKVDVLAHCYEYDAAGNKGISAGLDAFGVIESAQAPRQQFGNGINTAGAFGGGQQPAPQNAGGYQQQPAPQNAGGYQQQPAPQNAGGYQQQQQQPAPQNAGGYPVQAHDFLPQQGAAAPDVLYRTSDGGAWTEAQLLQAGYSPQQVQSLPRA